MRKLSAEGKGVKHLPDLSVEGGYIQRSYEPLEGR